jgi:hypothetical protein
MPASFAALATSNTLLEISISKTIAPELWFAPARCAT